MRKLATVREISDIKPIPKADNIEAARVDGWEVVIKKNQFNVGDKVIYCEIDSFIPEEVAPFLTPKDRDPKVYEGVKGNRLTTKKLRGQISQGLILPLNDKKYQVGDDLTEELGIKKYEPPVPAGEAEGSFPSYVPKTDQERIQNLTSRLGELSQYSYEVTEKLDGSSMTVIFKDGDIKVCSRNYCLQEKEGNTLWTVTHKLDLPNKLSSLGINIALQGELIGEGIQKNPYKIKGHQFYLFDIYDIDVGEYMSSPTRKEIVENLKIPHVPIINSSEYKDLDIDELLQNAEGKSKLNPSVEREGLVYKSPPVSFKTISNKFLLKS